MDTTDNCKNCGTQPPIEQGLCAECFSKCNWIIAAIEKHIEEENNRMIVNPKAEEIADEVVALLREGAVSEEFITECRRQLILDICKQLYPQEFFSKLFDYLGNQSERAFYAEDIELHQYYLDGWLFLSKFIAKEWNR